MVRACALALVVGLGCVKECFSAIGGCTTIVIGRGGSADGNVMASQTADSANGDFRMVDVPARDHAPGSKRALPRGDGIYMMYPRSSDAEHSPRYAETWGGVHPPEVVGYIDEVPHTYALWEALYGVMNEHGLFMGESTTPGASVGHGVPHGGTAMFTIGNLMTVALERCRTALCALQTMGDLAERHGFYGEDPGIDGAGEALTIMDAENDAWVFHIAGGVANRTGALWVAQRVPDGHVAVVANSFVIQEVDMSDADNFLGSANLLDDVMAGGFWDGTGTFNWQAAMAPDIDPSYESGLNMYDPFRQWRIFTLASPGAGLQPPTRLSDLPFSFPVSSRPSHLDLMNWNRDVYEGTVFDMRLGALAGPWGSPRRFGAGGSRQVPGQYARSVSVSWSIYTVLAQPAIRRPVLWYAADSAATSVFVPFFAQSLQAGGDGRYAVKEFGSGSMLSFSLANATDQPAWWAFNLVSNLMQLNYQNISMQYVFPLRDALQLEVNRGVVQATLEAQELSFRGPAEMSRVLADRQTSIQQSVARQWWDLASMLIVRYNDQSFNFPPHAPTDSVNIGLPASWLQMVGFDRRSYYPRWTQPASEPPSLLPEADLRVAMLAVQAQSSPAAAAPLGLAAGPSGQLRDSGVGSLALFGAACVAMGAVLGHAVGHRRASAAAARFADIPYVRAA